MASSLVIMQRGQVTTGAVTAYTVPAGMQALIKSIVVSNQGGTPAATVNVVASGGTAAESNAILDAVVQVANVTTVYSSLNIVMNAGDFISVKGSAATVNIYISGFVFDGSQGIEQMANF